MQVPVLLCYVFQSFRFFHYEVGRTEAGPAWRSCLPPSWCWRSFCACLASKTSLGKKQTDPPKKTQGIGQCVVYHRILLLFSHVFVGPRFRTFLWFSSFAWPCNDAIIYMIEHVNVHEHDSLMDWPRNLTRPSNFTASYSDQQFLCMPVYRILTFVDRACFVAVAMLCRMHIGPFDTIFLPFVMRYSRSFDAS